MNLMTRLKIEKIILVIFFIILVFSFFKKDNFKEVNDIDQDTLISPIQTGTNSEKITFEKDGYEYTLDPLFDYSLNGLVLSTQNYDTWYSLSRVDKTFTKDVCIVWGETVDKKGYQDPYLKIKQDFRFCIYSYKYNGIIFNSNEISNNHLMSANKEVEEKIKSIESGDQIKIKGKLVNVKGKAIGEIESHESREIVWDTSVSRDDGNAGACEIIYVEDIEIIKRGNEIYNLLFNISLWSIIIILGYKIIRSIIFIYKL